jgi:ubiquinol-cytochrome c reductase iron-sulfur subunit
MAEMVSTSPPHLDEGETRRDFLLIATSAVGVVGTALAAWPFIHSMNPATGVDLSPVEVGQRITVVWRGKPVFIDHRPEQDIKAAESTPLAELVDPQPDSERVQKPEWLVLVGVCTHLGCIPLGQKTGEPRGEYGGWFCPCHGSHYDTSGRIRKGPAPKNLAVPPYEFSDDTTIKIG